MEPPPLRDRALLVPWGARREVRGRQIAETIQFLQFDHPADESPSPNFFFGSQGLPKIVSCLKNPPIHRNVTLAGKSRKSL